MSLKTWLSDRHNAEKTFKAVAVLIALIGIVLDVMLHKRAFTFAAVFVAATIWRFGSRK